MKKFFSCLFALVTVVTMSLTNRAEAQVMAPIGSQTLDTVLFTVDQMNTCPGEIVHVTNTLPFNPNWTYHWYAQNAQPNFWTGYSIPQGITFYGGTNSNMLELHVTDTTTEEYGSYQIYINVWPEVSNLQISPPNPQLGCNNEPVEVSISGSNLQSYVWLKVGTTDTIGTNQTMVINESGQYKVFATNIYGCKSNYPYQFSIEDHAPISVWINIQGQTGDTVRVCESNYSNNYEMYANYNSSYGVSLEWENGLSSYGRPICEGGAYSVTATDPFGCISIDSLYFEILPLPNVEITNEGPLSFCEGSGTQLILPDGYIYNWNNGANTQTIVIDYSGIFWAHVENQFGCQNVTNSVQTFFNPKPVTPVVVYHECELAVEQPVQGDSYQWYFNGYAIPANGNGSAYYSAGGDGFYYVEVTNTHGCSSSSANEWFGCQINDFENSELSQQLEVSPNPSSEGFNVSFNDNQEHKVFLLDAQGRIISEEKGFGIVRIEDKNFTPGFYFIRTDKGSRKVTVQ